MYLTSCTFLRRAVVTLLAFAAAVGCVHAQESTPEKLKLKAGVTQNQDSNLRRSIDSKAVSDQINVQTVDVNVALPFGQQRLELDANLADNRYQSQTQFNYTGQNYNAALRWALTPTLVGALSTKRTETLNSAADSLDPNLRNTNVTKIQSLNANYLLGGPWQLFAEVSNGTSTNERAVLGITDVRYQSYTGGVTYVPNAGNTLAYARRVDSGTGISDYTYSGHAFVATLAPTTQTTLNGRIAYVEQRYAIDPKFDFSGITGGLEGTWHITPKTSLNAGWTRDIASFQTLESTHARMDTLSIAPNWQATPTLSIGLTYKQGLRTGLGSPNGVASTREDRTEETIWNVNWQPRAFVTFRGSVSNANRTSNVADQNYAARVVSLGAQFIY